MLNLKEETANPSPGIGHNTGFEPIDWASLLDPEGIRLGLTMEHERLIARQAEFIAAYERWCEKTAEGIKSEDVAATSTDFGAQLKRLAKQIEDTREVVKAPFRTADTTVQAFFRGIGVPLETAVTEVAKRIGAFRNAEAARLKREAEEKARASREEAERIARLASENMSSDLLEEAANLDQAAREAEKSAAAPLAAFSQTRGNYAVSSASVRYKFSVLNLADVPLEYLMIDESKVNKAINGKNRVTAIAGLEIIEETKTHIRG